MCFPFLPRMITCKLCHFFMLFLNENGLEGVKLPLVNWLISGPVSQGKKDLRVVGEQTQPETQSLKISGALLQPTPHGEARRITCSEHTGVARWKVESPSHLE